MQTRVPAPTGQAEQQQAKTIQQPRQLVGEEQVMFEDGRSEVTTQLRLQSLATNSPRVAQLKVTQTIMDGSPLMQQKEGRSRPVFQMKSGRNSGEPKENIGRGNVNAHVSGVSQARPIQLALRGYHNLVLLDPETTVNEGAKAEIETDAIAIDNAIEEGAASVRAFIAAVKSDPNNIDSETARLIGESVTDGYANNFAASMVRWVGGGAVPAKEAGYVVENYGNNEAKNRDVKTQYVLNSKRPDYFFNTAKTYTGKGAEHNANGLMDATTEKEGGGAHISDKVSNLSEEEMLDYPYLFETTYADLGFGGKVASPKKVVGQTAEEFYKKLKIKQAAAAKTRSSLRSAVETKNEVSDDSEGDEIMMDTRNDE